MLDNLDTKNEKSIILRIFTWSLSVSFQYGLNYCSRLNLRHFREYLLKTRIYWKKFKHFGRKKLHEQANSKKLRRFLKFKDKNIIFENWVYNVLGQILLKTIGSLGHPL